MKLADVTFPTSAAELDAMSSAELRVLVGKVDGGTGIHPKIASMGYHMTKAERIQFIGYHQYGVGSAESATQALTNAEGKYAIHQAKKGSKTGAKVVSDTPGLNTNCAASAATQLANLVDDIPPLTKFAADLDAWAKAQTGDVLPGDITKLLDMLKEASDAGAPFDEVAKYDKALFRWKDMLEAEDKFATAKSLGQVTDDAKLFDTATKLDEALADIPAANGPQFKAKAVMATTSNKTDASLASLDKLSSKLAKLDTSSPASTQLDGLVDLLDDGFANGDIYKLTQPSVKYLGDSVANAVVDVAEAGFPPEILADLDVLPGHLVDLFSKVTYAGKTEVLDALAAPLQNLQGVIDDAITAVANAGASDAVSAAQATYAQLSKAELKKLGVAKFKDAGVDVPSLAHYLTKDELAEALAKIDAGQDIAPLLDVAQAKKVAHKAGAKAASEAEKVPGSPVPALQANPTTVDTSVLSPADQATKAAKAAPPSTPAEVEQTIAPELGPAPDMMGTPGAKYPKPAQVDHSFTPAAKQQALGGAHTKHQYVDEDGKVWMWKKAETKGVADGEVLAHDIGWDLGMDMADIRYADGWEVPGKGRFPHGTVQKFHDGVKADMKRIGVSDMTPEQLQELQEHQVFDWLISQHDTHSENILVMQDGHLVPIDKGQAFKFFGNDQLAVGYSPPGNFGTPVYDDLWNQFASGNIDLDLDGIDTILARIEQIPDAEYEAKVRTYVKQRMKDKGKSLTFLPPELRSEDGLVNAIMARKHAIRDDMTTFYKAQAKRAGVKWEPIWEKRLAAAAPEKVAEAGAASITAGITTPVTKALADDVSQLATGGRAIHLAGKDINQGQALIYVEEAEDGKKILRMEMRLETAADDRVFGNLSALVSDQAVGTGNATSGGGGYLVDSEWDTVLAYAKTVGAHASDGAYNATTVAAAQKLEAELPAKLLAARKKATVALSDGDIETWATAKAEAEKLEQYAKHLEATTKAMTDGIPPPYKASQFDAAKAKQGWLAKAPDAPATPTPPVDDAQLFKKLEVRRDQQIDTVPTDEFLGRRRTGTRTDIQANRHGAAPEIGGKRTDYVSVGRQYEGDMEVNGTEVTARFRSYHQTSAVPRKGLLDLEIQDWDGNPDAIEKLLAAADRMGVDTRLATEQDEALTYWRALTGSWKQTVEYANPGSANASTRPPYKDIRQIIDGIEARIAKAGNLTPEQEAAIYREGYADAFGAEKVAQAPERIVHQRNIYGNEMGYGYIERFDLDADITKQFTASGQGWGYLHSTFRLEPGDLTSFAGPSSAGDLARLGARGGTTTSAEADLYTGGGSGIFSSSGWNSNYSSNRDLVVLRPAAVDRRIGNYAFNNDNWGAMADRQTRYSLDPTVRYTAKTTRDETIIRGGGTFGDDVEVVIVRSKAKREAILEDLRSHGVTEIRGRPIEERVYAAQTDAEAQKIIAQVAKERPESMFQPYAERPDAPAVKPKRVRKKAAPKVEPDPAPLATQAPPPDPFKAPPVAASDATKLANPWADIKHLDGLNNPYDDAFPFNEADLFDAMVQGLKETSGLTHAEAVPEVAKFLNIASEQTTVPFQQLDLAVKTATEYHGLAGDVAKATNATDKVEALWSEFASNSNGAKQHLAEVLFPDVPDATWDGTLIPEWQKNPTSVTSFLKSKAAELDGAATPSPTTLATDQVSNAGWVTASPGQKVANDAADKVFNYSIPGIQGKLPVQYVNLGTQGTKVIAQHADGNWYMVADATGKTSKEQLIEMLAKMGWPGVKATVPA